MLHVKIVISRPGLIERDYIARLNDRVMKIEDIGKYPDEQ